MCQALPPDLSGAARVAQENGFFSPTYFVFQMRIDGHPDPERGVPRACSAAKTVSAPSGVLPQFRKFADLFRQG